MAVHILVGARNVGRCDGSVDQAVVAVLQTRDVDFEYLLKVIG